ncbi:hypothetical protein [Halalkalicoccus salilacus]|uniref:hypothetical protein n=1 Tax=Halalkalicoccus salilacus TaxID=3117459 RepID=UPI00300EF891
MAEPTQLFSTLVPTAATVIALTLGFASTLYNSRIDKLQETTDALRTKFVDLRDKYQSVAKSMAYKLQEQGEFEDPRIYDIDPEEMIEQYGAEQAGIMLQYESQRIDKSVDEINEWAKDQEDDHAARAWGFLLNVSGTLNDVADLSDNLLDREQFRELRDSVTELAELFDVGTDENKELYRELTGNDPGPGYQTESILGESEAVADWLDRYIEEIDERREGWSSFEPHADGTNLVSFTLVIEELKTSVFETVGMIVGSALMSSSNPVATIRLLLWYAVGLGVTGVLLPLLFLITPSNSFQIPLTLGIFQVVQSILIGGSIVFAFLVFDQLFELVRQREEDI